MAKLDFIESEELENIFNEENELYIEGLNNGTIKSPSKKSVRENDLIQEGFEVYSEFMNNIYMNKETIPLTPATYERGEGISFRG